MFPLVYGRTKVMTDGGGVDLNIFYDYCGFGGVALRDYDAARSVKVGESGHLIAPLWIAMLKYLSYFAERFQRLPAKSRSGNHRRLKLIHT